MTTPANQADTCTEKPAGGHSKHRKMAAREELGIFGRQVACGKAGLRAACSDEQRQCASEREFDPGPSGMFGSLFGLCGAGGPISAPCPVVDPPIRHGRRWRFCCAEQRIQHVAYIV